MSTVRVRRRSPGNSLSASSLAAAVLNDTAAALTGDAATLNWTRSYGLKFEYRRLSDLTPARRNARTHSRKQIQQIAASIREFGFVNPVLVDEEGRVVAGHGRLEAARALGIPEVPTVRIDHLTETQKRAYVIADNRLAELAGWDRPLLAIEFAELGCLELDFALEITGFDTAEIDLLINPPMDTEGSDDEAPPPVSEGPAVSRPGDLWALGNHRLLCGDVRDPDLVARLLGGEQARMVFTDPPYNVSVTRHVSGLGRIRHREFAMASGEMSRKEFTSFLTTALGNLTSVSTDGSIHFVCIDWRHLRELLEAGETVYDELKNLIVWNKDNAGMGTFYRSQHELIGAFKKGTAPHTNNFGLGETGRYRTNVWSYAGANSFRPGRMADLAMHPTVKPVGLVADAIKDCSRRWDIILDGFGGSGTTLIAAHKTRRRGYLMEFDPLYVDVTIRRWQALTGEPAKHIETGCTVDELTARRAGADDAEHGDTSAEAETLVREASRG